MEKILLIPGLLCDETVWKPLLKILGNDLTSVANLRTQDDLTQMATDCLAQMPESFAIAGHSMGARVAMEMARLSPERVSRMVLLDTGIHPLGSGELDKRKEIVQFAYDNGMQALADRWLKGMVHAPNLKNRELMQALTQMVLRCDADLHARQITALTNRPDASSYLADIKCPILLLVGEEDQWSPVSQHEDMLALLPNARLEVIENAGHFAPLEQSAVVAKLIADFIV